MIEFRILKNSKKSGARIGILKTPHGEIETPALVPVATQAVVKTLTSEEARAAKCQILIANTFHLRLKPGEKIIKSSGGLHKFMNWQRPLMTDSGGFQVFSLGFGHDLGVGKVLGFFPGPSFAKATEGKQVLISLPCPSSSAKASDGQVGLRTGKCTILGAEKNHLFIEAVFW